MSGTRFLGAFVAGALCTAALVIVGTQAWRADAAPGDDDATYEPLAPCRLLDTRGGAFNVGPRSSPIGEDERFSITVTGSTGECTKVPTDAIGAALNVTAVGASAPTFVTIFPSDLVTVPNSSSLNVVPGAPPTPNKVDVKLSPSGQLDVYNRFGEVDVIVDLVGVYRPTSLTDLDARLSALENDAVGAELAALESRVDGASQTLEYHAYLLDARVPFVVEVQGGDQNVTDAWTSVVRVDVGNPTDATLLMHLTATGFESEAGADIFCAFEVNSVLIENDSIAWEAAGATAGSTAGEGDAGNLAGTSYRRVPADTIVRVLCRNRGTTGSSTIWDPRLTVLVIPEAI